MADVRTADVLFWVGCAGSYDARYQKVSRAFVQLMKMAGVNFAILGNEEKCNGDPARRMGNEYLAQTLMTDNIATMNSYGVKKIVVTCPHCLQSLGKEYTPVRRRVRGRASCDLPRAARDGRETEAAPECAGERSRSTIRAISAGTTASMMPRAISSPRSAEHSRWRCRGRMTRASAAVRAADGCGWRSVKGSA